jgi:hypothetical protein
MTCVLWFNAEALDKLILPEWSKIWETDIICEISLPTILKYYNVPLYDWSDALGFLRCHCMEISSKSELDVINKIKTNQQGIYHPIKGTIEEVFGK